MKWLEVEASFAEHNQEALLIYLLDMGIQGVIEEKSSYRFYLPADQDPKDLFVGEFRDVVYSSKLIKDENWAESWKKYWHVNKIGRFAIVPSWEEHIVTASEIVIDLDPGMAFGTGAHETTSLMLQLISDHNNLNVTVYDIGTGTGILGIAAAKLGAKVFAFDTDPLAIEATLKNAEKNGVKDLFTVIEGNLLEDEGLFPKESPDLVFTNILAEVIIQLVPLLKERLTHFTWLLSGIIKEREPAVLAALEESDFVITKRVCFGEWVALEAKI